MTTKRWKVGRPGPVRYLWVFLAVACQSEAPRPRPSLENARAHLGVAVPGTSGNVLSAPTASEASIDPTPASSEIVAVAAGQSITRKDLLEAWLFRDSPATRDALDRLVLDRLVGAEAVRLGVRLDPHLVAADWEQTLAEFDAQVVKADPGTTRDAYIESRLGLSPGGYLHALAERRRLDLLAARCVRAFSLESDAVEARLIVAPDRKVADLVEAGLTQGKAFADLARLYSVDPSASEGGSIAPIVRSMAPIARLAFATPIGEVGGPLEEEGRFLYLQAEEFRAGSEGPWSRLGPLVERSLATLGIEDLEFVQWQAMAVTRYEVDTRPLLQLLGGPGQ